MPLALVLHYKISAGAGANADQRTSPILVIRTALGVGNFVLITGGKYTVDMRTVSRKCYYTRNVLISGVFITGIHCIVNNQGRSQQSGSL